jgi:hypothetical protein
MSRPGITVATMSEASASARSLAIIASVAELLGEALGLRAARIPEEDRAPARDERAGGGAAGHQDVAPAFRRAAGSCATGSGREGG